MGRKLEDLTGKVYGRLTVIERAENDKHGNTRWLCKCSCGNECIVQAGNLKSGQQTCSRHRREIQRESVQKRKGKVDVMRTEYNGVLMTLKEVSKKTGINLRTLYHRFHNKENDKNG